MIFFALQLAPTPLWATAHLPLKGGDHARHRSDLKCKVKLGGASATRLISPLEGEMGGSPEGGGRQARRFHFPWPHP
jgi:hypothetical protein